MAGKTVKGKLCIEILEQYPKEATRTLARMLMSKNPDVFTDFDNTRSMLRRYRGEAKSKSTHYIVEKSIRTKKEKMRALSNLIESDYEKNKDYQMPTTANKVLVLSDIHFPYQDQAALDIALEYGYKNGCNAIYLNGDVLDMY